MTTSSRRTGEKGQRTPRSLNTYKEKGGVKGTTYCLCGAVYRNKRWLHEVSGTSHEGHEMVCPACRRIADRNPAAILSLSGDFFAAHEDEINKLIHHIAQISLAKNPLARVIDIGKDHESVVVTTTDVKLAQKIGREIFKSHGGELQYIWSHAESPVRVSWSR